MTKFSHVFNTRLREILEGETPPNEDSLCYAFSETLLTLEKAHKVTRHAADYEKAEDAWLENQDPNAALKHLRDFWTPQRDPFIYYRYPEGFTEGGWYYYGRQSHRQNRRGLCEGHEYTPVDWTEFYQVFYFYSEIGRLQA